MPRNGNGSYSLPVGNPVVTGTTISSSTHNTTMADIASALSQSLSKDGQTAPTDDLPMATYKHTGVGNASSSDEYAAAGQVQNSVFQYLTSVSGTNTITGSAATVTPTAYAEGQVFRFIPANTNTGATTLNISSLGAKNIYAAGAPCIGGEIRQNVPCQVYYDGTRFNLMGAFTGGIIPGLVVIGDSTSNITSYTPSQTPLIWVQGNIQQEIRINSYHDLASNPTNIVLMKSRGTAASPADVQNGDLIAGIIPFANSGNVGWHAGHIFSVIDGTFTSGQQPPARWDIYAAAANTSPNLVLSIKSSGTQTTGTSTVSGSLAVGTNSVNPNGYGAAVTVSNSGLAGVNIQTSNTDGDGKEIGDLTWNATTNSGAADTRVAYIRGTTSGSTANWRGGKLDLYTRTDGGVLNPAISVTNTQAVQFPNIGTTASAANAFIDNAANNSILRSTSRAEFKTDIEDINPDIVRNVMKSFRAVWFRSNCEADRKDWSYYGAISDELAKVDPRLVFWTKKIVGYKDEEYEDEEQILEEVEIEKIVIEGEKAIRYMVKHMRQAFDEYPLFDSDGNPVMNDREQAKFSIPKVRKVKKTRKIPIYGDPIPDGVQYDRLGVFALAALQLKDKGLL